MKRNHKTGNKELLYHQSGNSEVFWFLSPSYMAKVKGESGKRDAVAHFLVHTSILGHKTPLNMILPAPRRSAATTDDDSGPLLPDLCLTSGPTYRSGNTSIFDGRLGSPWCGRG